MATFSIKPFTTEAQFEPENVERAEYFLSLFQLSFQKNFFPSEQWGSEKKIATIENCFVLNAMMNSFFCKGVQVKAYLKSSLTALIFIVALKY